MSADREEALPSRDDNWQPSKAIRTRKRGIAEGTAANPHPKRYGGRYMVGLIPKPRIRKRKKR